MSSSSCSSRLLVGPRISRDDVYRDKIWCRVGKALRLENVNVEGEPPAKVTWHYKGKDLAGEKDVTIDNPDYLTSIVIRDEGLADQ